VAPAAAVLPVRVAPVVSQVLLAQAALRADFQVALPVDFPVAPVEAVALLPQLSPHRKA
jgi:hypothetical protein